MKKSTIYDREPNSNMLSHNGLYYDDMFIYELLTTNPIASKQIVSFYTVDDDGHPAIITRFPLHASRGYGDWVDALSGEDVDMGDGDIEDAWEEERRLQDAGYEVFRISGYKFAFKTEQLGYGGIDAFLFI